METKLKIKNFKRIKEEIIIEEFDYVNYFVGQNGSGKTSILNALSYLKDPTNARQFFGPLSINEFLYNGETQSLIWNVQNPNKVDQLGNLNPDLYLLISNSDGEKGVNGLKAKATFLTAIGIGNTESLIKFNNFLKEIGHGELVAKKFVDNDDPFNQDNGRLIFESELGNIDPSMIADGLKVLYNLKHFLYDWIVADTNSIKIIILEEPENNLHPNLQKDIPKILDLLYNEIKPENRNKILFFISTHSPFIISSGAKFKNQKVYPINNGKPLEIDDHQNWKEKNYSKGYSGSECAYIVSKMLGADITDIGYPENYGILEEYSLQIILDVLRVRGIIKNIQFVSASGVVKSLNLAETILELEKLNTLIKCNPYYFDKYFIIIDNTIKMDASIKAKVDRIQNKLGSRYIELKKASLEDYYFNINEEIAKEAKKEIEESNRETKGLIKAKYAEIIASQINDFKTFSKLFDKELDFLQKTTSNRIL